MSKEADGMANTSMLHVATHCSFYLKHVFVSAAAHAPLSFVKLMMQKLSPGRVGFL